MKKLLITILFLVTLVYADLVSDGSEAWYSKNYKEAKRLWTKAANQGNAEAQNNLGMIYYNGKGVRHDKSKAKELFGKSCDNGYQKGCDNYRILNEQGIK